MRAPSTPAVLADDREWFRVHPYRTHRLRPAFAVEATAPDVHYVLVRQVTPGHRERIPLCVGNCPPGTLDTFVGAVEGDDDGHRCDDLLQIIFDRALCGERVELLKAMEEVERRAELRGHA